MIATLLLASCAEDNGPTATPTPAECNGLTCLDEGCPLDAPEGGPVPFQVLCVTDLPAPPTRSGPSSAPRSVT